MYCRSLVRMYVCMYGCMPRDLRGIRPFLIDIQLDISCHGRPRATCSSGLRTGSRFLFFSFLFSFFRVQLSSASRVSRSGSASVVQPRTLALHLCTKPAPRSHSLISGRLSFVTRATVRLSRTRPHPIGMRHTPHPASHPRGTVELRLRPRLALLL